ncbi:MAG: lytic murein transglycosylase [Deltaproteobacteria bacterium]|nr:lytic murein transglycosylase [Deltaproteobacteria bacterium]
MKKTIISCLFLIFFLSVITIAGARDNSSKQYIEDLLVAKGLERDHVQQLLRDPRVSIDAEIIMKNLFYSSPKGSTMQPEYMEIDPKFFDKGKKYIEDNESIFSSIQSRFAISAEVITAILIVESRLGTYPEKYNVFTAYTNLAVILDPAYLDTVQRTHGKDFPKLNDPATIERAQKKARWALNELYQLIILADELGLDPLAITGSFAGALGPGQFIPSSFIEYGRDGDGDGRKDPFNMADAMASIAHYLKRAGWEEGASIEKKRKAVWYYNHSEVYVNTIMMLYERLKA